MAVALAKVLWKHSSLLATIMQQDAGDHQPSNQREKNPVRMDSSSEVQEDAVSRGLISPAEAEGLFGRFVNHYMREFPLVVFSCWDNLRRRSDIKSYFVPSSHCCCKWQFRPKYVPRSQRRTSQGLRPQDHG